MPKKKSVEIVIPIYNEEVELSDSIMKLHSHLKQYLRDFNWHITIADNASTDMSLTIARKLSKKLSSVGYLHLSQKGRGRAVKKAWSQSKAQVLVYMDVDLSTDLKYLNSLISSIADKGYDIAIGSRLLEDSQVIDRTLKREVLSRCYNILIKILFFIGFSDAQCGFKAISKQTAKMLLPHIIDNEWFFDSELLIVGEKMGYKIYEVPVRWVDNPGSTVRVLKTVTGDLKGLLRLFFTRPWNR